MFKIISGGQTGADRAGLDAASNMGVPTGGYAPSGYRTEKGSDPSLAGLGLLEDSDGEYKHRTLLNVEEADGTILFGRTSPGYNLTSTCCTKAQKPILKVNFPMKSANPNRAAQKIYDWIIERGLRTVNIAGNRESKNPGIYDYVFQTMIQVCQKLKEYEGKSR